MSFHETRFPADLSFGAMGGPERRTDVVELSSGHEERNTPWAQSRRRFDAGLGLRSTISRSCWPSSRRGVGSFTGFAGRIGRTTNPACRRARCPPGIR